MGKFTDYTELASTAAGDLFPVVDVSDTSQAPTGTLKYISAAAQRLGIELFNTPTSADHSVFRAYVTGHGTKTINERHNGVLVQMEDDASVVTKTITGAVNNGSGLIRLTATAHSLVNGDGIAVWGVGGVTNANGSWTVTDVTTNTVDLVGSTFAGTYTSGGSLTNRPMMYGVSVAVIPKQARGGITGTAQYADDVNCFVGYNAGTAKATDAYYLGRNTGIAGSEWITGFTIDANCDYGINLNGTFAQVGLDMSRGTFTTGTAILLPNNVYVRIRNAANTADGSVFKLNTFDELQFDTGLLFSYSPRFEEGANLVVGAGTGTKVGTATTQKLGFWNATPVVRPAAVADATDAATAISQLNALLSRLRTIGLVAP